MIKLRKLKNKAKSQSNIKTLSVYLYMNEYIKKALIKSLKDVGIMKFGDFTLRYGVKSDKFILISKAF